MKFIKNLSILLLLFSSLQFAQSVQKFAELGDFRLENGEVIKNCRIGYHTWGTMNAEKSNVIIYPTWFNGTSGQIGGLIGPNKLLDSTGYYIIAIDALGNGVSSSPSNSTEQPGYKFPHFTMRDIVAAQHEMLTRMFGLSHVFAALGGSMGSMQVFEWVTAYPDYIGRAVPYVPTPWSSSYDIYFWSIGMKIIDAGVKYNLPDKEVSQLLNMLQTFVARTPTYIDSTLSRDKMDSYLNSFDKPAPRDFPPVNWAYQTEAMLSHDITRHHEGSKETTAASIKARLFMIIAAKDHILNPHPAMELAKLTKAETLILQDECGHLSVNCQLDLCREKIAEFLNKK